MSKTKMTTQRKRALISSGVISVAALFVIVAVTLMFANRPAPAEPVNAEVELHTPTPWPVQTKEPAADAVPGDGTFPDVWEVDRWDPDEVAEAVATLTVSHDTLTDETETDGTIRAFELMDPVLRGQIKAPEKSSVGPEWLEAQQHEAYSVPVLTPSFVPPPLEHGEGGDHKEDEDASYTVDGEEIRPYKFEVSYSWQGRDGWVSEPEDAQVRLVVLSLAERGGKWVVVTHYYGDPVTSEYSAG